MKGLSPLVYILFITAFIACSDDEQCTQMDWIGTYTGVVNCDGEVEEVTIRISADGAGNILIVSETNSLTSEYQSLEANGCLLSITESAFGISASIDVELNGNKLTISESFSGSGLDIECQYNATRQ